MYRRGSQIQRTHLDIVYAHRILAHELVPVVEGRFKHYIPAQGLGSEHVFRGRGVDGLLPRVRGVRHHESKREEPLCGRLAQITFYEHMMMWGSDCVPCGANDTFNARPHEVHALLQPEAVQLFVGMKLNFARYSFALQYFLWNLLYVNKLGYCQHRE